MLRLALGDVRAPVDRNGGGQLTVRCYRDTDLPECLRLVQQAGRRADLACQWDAAHLSRQLSFNNIPSTLVAERNGSIVGFANYHQLCFQGRDSMRAGMIDHFACDEVGLQDQVRLLHATIADMRNHGVQFALTSHMSGASRGALLRSGFIPMWPGVRLIFFTDGSDVPVHSVRTLHVPLV